MGMGLSARTDYAAAAGVDCAASERAVLETVTLVDIVSGELPPSVAALTDNPQAWV